jgi:hypothetical protein
MSDLKKAAQQALEALENSRVFVTTREKIKHPEGAEWYDERISALKAALAQQQEQRLVLVPEGLAQSDAEFWLDKRDAIIDACRAQGFTIVITANGVRLMRLGKIEAKTALAQQEPRNQCGETCERAKLCAVCARGLAQQEQEQEPVTDLRCAFWLDPECADAGVCQSLKFKANPPRREWVSLTEEERVKIIEFGSTLADIARAIEAALKERNT